MGSNSTLSVVLGFVVAIIGMTVTFSKGQVSGGLGFLALFVVWGVASFFYVRWKQRHPGSGL